MSIIAVQIRCRCYTKLVAPFDGVAGIRLLDVGKIIHATTSRSFPGEPNALVIINQVQPISVMVTLAAADIPKVQDALAKGSVEVIALSADGKTELDTGTLAAIDNQASTPPALSPSRRSSPIPPPLVARYVCQRPGGDHSNGCLGYCPRSFAMFDADFSGRTSSTKS
jgi:hypothetical protein